MAKLITHEFEQPPKPEIDLAELERQKAEFIARGGQIKVLPSCEHTERNQKQEFTIRRPDTK